MEQLTLQWITRVAFPPGFGEPCTVGRAPLGSHRSSEPRPTGSWSARGAENTLPSASQPQPEANIRVEDVLRWPPSDVVAHANRRAARRALVVRKRRAAVGRAVAHADAGAIVVECAEVGAVPFWSQPIFSHIHCTLHAAAPFQLPLSTYATSTHRACPRSRRGQLPPAAPPCPARTHGVVRRGTPCPRRPRTRARSRRGWRVSARETGVE